MSAPAIQATGGGMYAMDGQSYDLSTLISTLGLQRANLIEGQILDQANAMKKRNETIQGLSTALAKLRAGEDDGALFNSNTLDTGIAKPGTNRNYTLRELMESQGIKTGKWDTDSGGSDWIWGKEEKKEAIETIKAKIDSLNSDSQMDQIRLQGLVTKRDQNFDMVSNLMSKDAKTKDTIIGNMR